MPLNDALRRDSRFRYLFGLHEIPVMAMADGYAQATGSVGVVNLHIACGLGNAMGMLYNAHVSGTPLIVTAGQQDRRLRFEEPVLEADLVRVAQPWTKWAAEVNRVDDIPNAVRRAIQTALTPPTGPVFLSLPLDVQLETASGLDLRPPFLPDRRTCPSKEGLRRASQMLMEAKRPAILAGSRVLEAGATEELASLADALGDPVFAENTTTHGRMPIRSDHPLYQGILPYWSPEVQEALKEFDVLFVVGMNLLRLYIFQEPARPIAETTRILHLDSNPWEVGKNYPVDVGLIGDPKTGLAELVTLLNEQPTPKQGSIARERAQLWTERKKQAREKLNLHLAKHQSDRPMSSWTMMAQLAEVLPPNVAVVEEAITTHHNVLEQLGVVRDPAAQFAHRGWALGWGMGSRPRRQARLAGPTRRRSHRRRLRPLRHPGPLVRRPPSNPRHLRHLQQSRVPHPQGLRRAVEPPRLARNPRPGSGRTQHRFRGPGAGLRRIGSAHYRTKRVEGRLARFASRK